MTNIIVWMPMKSLVASKKEANKLELTTCVLALKLFKNLDQECA
jgi:hypothetical protein